MTRLRTDILGMAQEAFPTLRWSFDGVGANATLPGGLDVAVWDDGRAFVDAYVYEQQHDSTPAGIRKAVRKCIADAERDAKRALRKVEAARAGLRRRP